jgi:diphosphomevalonate decarboxylase
MTDLLGAAIAHPNIAFIKYWGNLNDDLRLAANSSLSINLAALETRTMLAFTSDDNPSSDTLTINDQQITGAALQRVTAFLDVARDMAGTRLPARVTSTTNFPIGAGIASSAAAFAALALAASQALHLPLTEPALSRLARRGSGSACRSVPGGFVEWQAGSRDEDSFAFSIAPANHWGLVDCIAVIEDQQKQHGSTAGHALAWTSPLQAARLADGMRRLDLCRQAVMQKDFEALALVVEQDSHLMHAVMMTSQPALFYWAPFSLTIMKLVPAWRRSGIPVCYTFDAGANAHVITTRDFASTVANKLGELDGIKQIITSGVGGSARLWTKDLDGTNND